MRLVALIVLAASVLAVATARDVCAQEAGSVETSRAKDLKTRADDLVEQGFLSEAVELYTQSIALLPDPSARYNKGRTLASLGRYPEAVAELERFEAEASPELKARAPALGTFMQQLRGRVSHVAVTCDATGARVRFRGVEVGTTPLASDIVSNAGAATIEIEKEGYFPYRRTLELPGGGRSLVDAHLVSRATMGVVNVTSPVLGSSVTIDDRPMGSVPLEVPLPAGTHTVTVAHEGYRSETVSFQIEAGATREVPVRLEKEAGLATKWWFWTAIGASLLAGGVTVYALTTEKPLEKGSLPPGNFTVGFRGF